MLLNERLSSLRTAFLANAPLKKNIKQLIIHAQADGTMKGKSINYVTQEVFFLFEFFTDIIGKVFKIPFSHKLLKK